MAIAFRASNNSGFLTRNVFTTDVTKPSGLSVGDLMYGVVFLQSNMTVVTVPSGFNLVEDIQVGGGSPNIRLFIYQKIADSADVAASVFTFSQAVGGSTNTWFCGVVAFSGVNQTMPTQSQTENSDTSVSTTVVANLTGISGTNILFAVSGCVNDVGFSAFTSSPSRTWNPIFSGTTTIGDDSTLSFAYSAVDTTSTNTDITATYSSASGRIGIIATSIAEAALGPTTVKTWNDIALSAIKTINGVAIASIKSINGRT